MAHRSYKKQGRTVPALVLGTGAYFVLEHSGPVLVGSEINPLSAGAASVLALSAAAGAADLFWFIGSVLDWLKARKTTGLKGTAGFVRSLREIRRDLVRYGWGPYWGTFKNEPIFADFASNALTLGPAGSGKGVGVIQPTALAIDESKTIICFKGENTAVLAIALEERGEIIRILNIGDMWTERLGKSDLYNPLVVITDDYWRPGGLQDISDDVHEMTLQLYPNPEGGKGDNKYFHDGSRTLIGFAIQTCIIVKGSDATLGDVAQMLNDRQSLLFHAKWAAGRLPQEGGNA